MLLIISHHISSLDHITHLTIRWLWRRYTTTQRVTLLLIRTISWYYIQIVYISEPFLLQYRLIVISRPWRCSCVVYIWSGVILQVTYVEHVILAVAWRPHDLYFGSDICFLCMLPSNLCVRLVSRWNLRPYDDLEPGDFTILYITQLTMC